MSSPVRTRPTDARLLLSAIILAITLGPRVRLPGFLDCAVDLRVQDFVLIPALLVRQHTTAAITPRVPVA